MTGTVCDHYNSCLVTPEQKFPNNFETYGNDKFMKCVSYIPCQQGGFVVGNNYNFSEGFSVDPCCNLDPNGLNQNNFSYENNDFDYQGNYNFSNDYSFADGFNLYQNPNTFPQNDSNLTETRNSNMKDKGVVFKDDEKGYFQVNGTQVLPEGFTQDGNSIPLTPSFFASNSSFKRIPLNAGRSIFRRRRPGDCNSEWSNAFDKDYEDGFFNEDEFQNN